MTFDLWLALLCAVLFSAGALLVKRANQLGVGPWETTLVSNLTTALGLMALWPMGGQIPSWSLWWQPAVVAVSFIAGQAFVFLAYHRGDVSVATPVLGVKIVLVAVFTTLIGGDHLPWQLWLGAVLSTLAVVLLNRTDRAPASGKAGMTVALAVGCALFFALFDALVQNWGPAWGAGRFLPVMMLMVAVLSLVAHPFFGGGMPRLKGGGAAWLWSGTGLIALQSTIFVAAIVVYKNAAPANVIFSSRGLWTVALVGLAGRWFQSSEQHAGGAVLRWRLIGAVVMMSAIALVMFGKR
ncbi:MAG: DMT family transporter [Verrucomicrobiaceae bacterium]|nr:DMT family transporter [Verrucomicrobiaceae bacterium]